MHSDLHVYAISATCKPQQIIVIHDVFREFFVNRSGTARAQMCAKVASYSFAIRTIIDP